MSTINPYVGLGAGDLAALSARLNARSREEVDALIAASGHPTNEQAGTTFPNPWGAYVNADGQIVVDDFTADIQSIPEIVRAFSTANEGYWIEQVFNTPGWTVTGGAVRYSIQTPDDHFLASGKRPAPRAPGSEAPILAGTVRRPILKAPESLSGRIEVTDEARQDNDVIGVQRTFAQTGNTFALLLQEWGEETLDELVETQDRIVWGGSGTFSAWAAADPIYNFASTDPRPSQEIARVQRLFFQEKGGVQADTLMWAPEDAEHFERVYEDRADAVLAQYGIRQTLRSNRLTAGVRRYLRSGQVGTMAWAKPIDTEPVREGKRKTDVYVLDGRVVFVANGADAILEVRDEAES